MIKHVIPTYSWWQKCIHQSTTQLKQDFNNIGWREWCFVHYCHIFTQEYSWSAETSSVLVKLNNQPDCPFKQSNTLIYTKNNKQLMLGLEKGGWSWTNSNNNEYDVKFLILTLPRKPPRNGWWEEISLIAPIHYDKINWYKQQFQSNQ